MPHERESFSNIFDAASKLEKKSIKKQEAAVENLTELTDDELNARFDRCKELHNLMHDRIEKAFSDHRVTLSELRNYFDSPQNFSESQWRLIQEQKDEIKKQLKELVPTAAQKGKKPQEKSQTQKRPKSMQTKSRWMPMR